MGNLDMASGRHCPVPAGRASCIGGRPEESHGPSQKDRG